jgi:hypothetical protein
MIELIIGLGIVGFLIAYLFFQSKDEKEHLLLRILLLGILFGVFVLIGKASLDSTTQCSLELNQTVTDGNTTNYSYAPICYSVTENTTALTFYKVTLWIVRLISLYLLVYFIWHVWKWFSAIISGKYGRAKK